MLASTQPSYGLQCWRHTLLLCRGAPSWFQYTLRLNCNAETLGCCCAEGREGIFGSAASAPLFLAKLPTGECCPFSHVMICCSEGANHCCCLHLLPVLSWSNPAVHAPTARACSMCVAHCETLKSHQSFSKMPKHNKSLRCGRLVRGMM